LMEGPKFLRSFDFPGGKITQGRRDVTNVPAQALTLLNDRFVLQQAGFWADRLTPLESESVAGRLQEMFREALGRPATASEIDRFENLVDTLAGLHQTPHDEILSAKPIWKDVAHVMFNLKEFIYIP
ncbi:MAG: DUF1553 domain-containing protein, partial [Planctomycetes bacterium]|nr:DUF1553 domain-containing protein [Planctomycetota bacterium]